MPRNIKNAHLTCPGHFDPQYGWGKDQLRAASYCLEKGQNNGTEHTHICLRFWEPGFTKQEIIRDFASWNGLQEHQVNVVAHPNWQTMVGYHTGRGEKPPCPNYCPHTDDPFGDIHPPRRHQTLNEEIRARGLVNSINQGYVPIHQFLVYQRAMAAFLAALAPSRPITARVRCFYLWGPPGSGKTRTVRDHFPGAYFKDPTSKWWDGYAGSRVVCIDEVGPDFDTTLFKLWLDPWPQGNTLAEVKGGTVELKYLTVYVTSNYPLEALCAKHNQDLYEAMKRRFMGIIRYD